MSDDIQKIESVNGGQVAQNVHGDMVYQEINYYVNHQKDAENKNIKVFTVTGGMNSLGYEVFEDLMKFIESQKILSDYDYHKWTIKIVIPKLEEYIKEYEEKSSNYLSLAKEIKSYEIAKECLELLFELCYKSILKTHKSNIHALWISSKLFFPRNFAKKNVSTVANGEDERIDKFIREFKYYDNEKLIDQLQYLKIFHYVTYPECFIFKNKVKSINFYYEQRTIILDNEYNNISKNIERDIFTDNAKEFSFFRNKLFIDLIKDYVHMKYNYSINEYFHLDTTYDIVYSEKQEILKEAIFMDTRISKWFNGWAFSGLIKNENLDNYESFCHLNGC